MVKTRYIIIDWELGFEIDSFETLEEAKMKVQELEERDKFNKEYVPNYYRIYDSETKTYGR